MSSRVMPSSRAPKHSTKAVHTIRRLLFIVATLVAVLPASILIVSSPASAATNTNFIGNWKVSGGYLGFIIKSENLRTGVCTGTTPLPQYHLIACRVTGNKYSFTITDGPSYRSHNIGTIEGNHAAGQFKDTNGTFVQYTAVRAAR